MTHLLLVSVFAVIGAAGAQKDAPGPCNTAALMAAINPLTAACCPNGDQCAGGPPPTCSEACASTFLPFMDTYNHGACMPMLQLFGANLHLGDLEAECRDSLSTDGGEDATAIDCSPAAGMSIAMVCSQETGADAAFCDSACFQALNPYYETCQALMPEYMTMMLMQVIPLMQACDAAADGTAAPCDMVGMTALCTAPDSGMEDLGEDIPSMCGNPCIQAMIPCANDPMLAMMFGEDFVGEIGQIELMCDEGGEGASGPGDGVCEMASLMAYMGPENDPDVLCPDGSTACMCATPQVAEMIDCIDNPVFAEDRDELVPFQTLCAGSDAPGGAEGAGDDICNEMSMMDMCDDDTLEAAMSGDMEGAEICGHPCAQEMIDCIDSPFMSEDMGGPGRPLVATLQTTCEGEQAECLPIVANMNEYFDEACCSGAGQPACPDGPPATCTTGCSAMYLPFWSDCGSVVTGLGQGNEDFAAVSDQMSAFYDTCRTAHPGKGDAGRGGGRDDGACVDDPQNVLAAQPGNLNCPTLSVQLAVMGGCNLDLHLVAPAVPAGTTLASICPLTCNTCTAGGGH